MGLRVWVGVRVRVRVGGCLLAQAQVLSLLPLLIRVRVRADVLVCVTEVLDDEKACPSCFFLFLLLFSCCLNVLKRTGLTVVIAVFEFFCVV